MVVMVTEQSSCTGCLEPGRCPIEDDCTLCPKGHYNNNTKQSKCMECFPGEYNE